MKEQDEEERKPDNMNQYENKPIADPTHYMTDGQYKDFLEAWHEAEDTVIKNEKRFYKIVKAILGALLAVAVFYVTFAVLNACGVLR